MATRGPGSVRIEPAIINKFIKDQPEDELVWIYENGAKELFYRIAAASGCSYVRLNDWLWINPKLKKKLTHRIRGQVADHLSQNLDATKWLPFSIDQLVNRLEETGIDWDNLDNLHIDHIKPKSKFKFQHPEDKSFQECWSLENLRAISAEENLKKSAKYVEGR